MEQTARRSLLERAFGRSKPWLSWVWAALACVWIVSAFLDPSAFHTVMAVTWSALAVARVVGDLLFRHRERTAARTAADDELVLR